MTLLDTGLRASELSAAARRAVWRYLADREDGEDANAPLFLVKADNWRL